MGERRLIDKAEEWTALALRVGTFAVGVVLLMDAKAAEHAEAWQWILGGGCLGPIAAQGIATIVASVRGGGQ